MVAPSGKGGKGLGLGKHVQGDSTVSVMFYFFKLRKVYTGVLLHFSLYCFLKYLIGLICFLFNIQ